jgi:hypothetical protein
MVGVVARQFADPPARLTAITAIGFLLLSMAPPYYNSEHVQ